MEQLDKVINQLKDIKEPQFIDTSKEFLIFYTLIAAAILIALFLVWFFLFKKRKRRRKLSKKELALKELKELDFSNTKDAVYKFSVNAKILASNEQQERLEEIINRLQKYKYKKEVPTLEEDDIKLIKNFIKELKI